MCDLGCGPGQIARYLAAHGVEACGIDAAPSMITTARRLNPTLPFQVGNFFALPLPDGALAGIAAFYCLIHCARHELGQAITELHRVLQSGGRLLMTVHAGEGEVGRDEAFGKPVALVATLFSEAEGRDALEGAGFGIDAMVTRPPYDFEYQIRRLLSCGR